MSSAAEGPLYERLGGYDVIAAAVDHLFQRLIADPMIGVYWKGHSTDSRKRDRQLLVDYLCQVSGGPVAYQGRDMKTAHEGLQITEREWQIFLIHTLATAHRFQMPEREREELLDIFIRLKPGIVERP